MKKKQPVYKGLDKTSVLYNDQSEYSPEIFDIKDYPKRLTAGKNIFRFRGNLENLAQNSPLDIEIIDYNGEPIYHEITTYIAEDKSRVVSIYIYPDTSPGPATITLLTEIQRINGTAVPENWKNVYNAKWSRTVYVNPTLDNESEIIFETLPTVEIEEQIGVQLDRTYSVSQFPTYNSGSVKYVSRNGSPILIISGGAFSSSMKGGTVTVNSPNNPFPDPTYTFTAVPYSTKVKKVLNTSSILLDTEYNIASTHSIVPHTYTDFNYSSYNLEYEQVPSYVVTENSESYAIIKINNLQPLTGDISRIKTFINNNGTVGTWEQISDIELEETEIFVSNTASLTPDTSIGTIYDQTTIDTYYTSSIYTNNILIETASLTYNNSVLSNSMQISGSGDVIITQIKNQYAGSFIKDAEYKIVLDAIGQKTLANASISIYLSGSAFNLDVTDKYNNQFPKRLGKKIGQLYLNESEQTKRYDDITFSFKSDETGDGVLLFVLESGQWYISDIRTTSDNDPGYTPNYTRIRTLVPTSHKSDVQLNFKVEYYNAGGVKCKQINYINKVPWAGGNRYIDGEYSMITGSLYVADSLNSGIAISGYSNSGFVRSLGYNGFAAAQPGFLLWSGSAMSGSAGTKGGVPYTGVGLEMYANSNNYFRYSTTDSELDIRTNNIFIGNNTTFISSSNGNIKISGSNVEVQTPNFFLGDASTQYISGSNGTLQISSSNVLISSSGYLYAREGIFQDRSVADLFIYRNVAVTTVNSSSLLSTFTDGGKTYYALNLTGSGDDNLTGYGPSMFVSIRTDLNYPIGRINIHDLEYYWPTTGGRNFQKAGALLILEDGGYDFYLTKDQEPPQPSPIVPGQPSYAANYQDSWIASNTDDIFEPAFQTRTVNGTSYDNTIKFTSGAHIVLVQSQFAWRIMSVSSTDGIPVQFYDNLILPNLPTSNPGGSGIVWNDGGILKIT